MHSNNVSAGFSDFPPRIIVVRREVGFSTLVSNDRYGPARSVFCYILLRVMDRCDLTQNCQKYVYMGKYRVMGEAAKK